jgi:hypothetical protein
VCGGHSALGVQARAGTECHALRQDAKALRLRQLRALGNVSVACVALICALWVESFFSPLQQTILPVPLSSSFASWWAAVLESQRVIQGEDALKTGPQRTAGLPEASLIVGIISFAILFLIST